MSRGTTATLGDRRSREAESVVGVFERWWNTRASRASTDLDVVSPRAASRGTAITVAGSTGISFGRVAVVVSVVPVSAPFMHVVAQVMNTVGVGWIQSHQLRPTLPTLSVIGNQLGRRVSPRVQREFGATASGAFPLGFARQAIGLTRLETQPLAVGHSLMPRERDDRHLRMIEI